MKNSNIEWTTHTFNPWSFPQALPPLQLADISNAVRLEVLKLVTLMAKGEPIAYIKAQILMAGKWLNVVRTEISSARVPALLTGIFISAENSFAPDAILGLSAVIEHPLLSSVFPCVMGLPARGSCLGYHADFKASGSGHWPAFPRSLSSFSFLGHKLLSGISVLPALEGGVPTLGANLYLNTATIETGAVPSISASSVASKCSNWLPRFASNASFFSALNAAYKIIKTQPSGFRCGLHRANFRLSHSFNN